MSKYDLATVNQIIFLSSILAGFSITIVVQFITSSRQQSKLMFTLLSLFIIAGILFLGSIVCGSLALIKASQESFIPRFDKPGVDSLGMQTLAYFLLGLLMFSLGGALIGWTYSKLLGFVSSLAMLFLLVIIVRAFISLGRVYQ